jgi:oligogalacturonide transport system substrate-binding protein
MKKIFALLFVLVLAVTAVGCSGNNNTQPSNNNSNNTQQPSASSGDTIIPGVDDETPVTIRFSWWGGDSRHSATQEVIRLFQEENPHITVLPEFTAWNGHYEKIATQLIGRTEADLMQINFNWFYVFSPEGEGFYDLSTLKSLTLDNWEKESLEPLTINGKVQGVPTSIGGRLWYLNKTIYDQAGVEIPTTWDEYMAAGRAFEEKLGPGYYPLGAIAPSNAHGISLTMFGYLAQLTGKNIIEDNKLAYTEEELVQGFQFVSDLMDNHVIPTAYDDSALKDSENQNWIEGRYAGVYEWNSSISKYVDNLNPALNSEIIIAPYPTIDGSKASGAFNKVAMAFAISKNSKNPEVAAKFLEFFYTNPTAVEAHGLQRAVPVNKVSVQILENAGLLKGLEYEGHIIVQETNGMPFHPYYEDAEVAETYLPLLDEYAYLNLTPEAAAARLVAEFDVALEAAMSR